MTPSPIGTGRAIASGSYPSHSFGPSVSITSSPVVTNGVWQNNTTVRDASGRILFQDRSVQVGGGVIDRMLSINGVTLHERGSWGNVTAETPPVHPARQDRLEAYATSYSTANATPQPTDPFAPSAPPASAQSTLQRR